MQKIKDIVSQMKVPDGRITDFPWLIRNLGIQNSAHPRFEEAMKLIKEELKIKNK